ncbi:MAG: hypothetical protein Q4B70_16750 [Lachnospiraceae bacterium]|nr:hypothetical protein [Lachnospiraceae bacterium]
MDVYCPWDVINYCHRACLGVTTPENFWANTSGNFLVPRLIQHANQTTKGEIEDLIAGKVLFKTIKMELTYGELFDSVENIWSVLFSTGYLTLNKNGGLIIPNEEIRSLFISQIQIWM